MGVQNLWMLLAPVGRQIEIETLASQVLAVDASIWLTQFVKAMRDDEGNMIKNAHLIGTFHRVAKLLFYRIRPVFVFDGNTPEIKKRTVAKRRKRQEHQAANLKQTAQRILLNRLKLYREELKKNGGKPKANPAIDPSFLIPGVTAAAECKDDEEEQQDPGVITIGESEDEEDETSRRIREQIGGDTNEDASGSNREDDEDEEMKSGNTSDDDHLSAEDIELDTSRMSRIDFDAVFAMPPHLQKDVIERIQRDRRQEARDQFIPLAGNPEAYSRTQISSFLKTSKLNRQIHKARQKNAQHEMQKAASASADSSEGGALLGQGKRIASSGDRFFILEQAKKPSSDDESDGEDGTRPRQPVHFELTQPSNVEEIVDSENDDDVFERIHGSKRTRRYMEEGSAVAKKSLGEFSIDSVKEFTFEMNRAQRRKIAVQEARRKFLEKEKIKQEEEPLEIEIARRARNPELPVEEKKTEEVKLAVSTDIMIKIKPEDVASLDEKVKQLFPSMFEDAKTPSEPVSAVPTQMNAEDEDEDEIDWEDVTVAETAASAEKANIASANKVPAPPMTTAPEEMASNDEDDIQWESVSPVLSKVEETTAADEKKSGDVVRLDEDSDEDVQWEEVKSEAPRDETKEFTLDAKTSASAGSSDVVELDQDSSEEEAEVEASDLYASLQFELEEEKAEEDLSALKQEALQSALTTASNLTQWAAGAVRRALAEHTRHLDMKPTSAKVSTPEWKPMRRGVQQEDVAESVIDLSEDAEMEASHEFPSGAEEADSVEIIEEASGALDEDQVLQRAIEESMAESSESRPATRYLQYAPPAEPEPEVDVAALAEEQRELKKLRNRQMRGVEGMSEDMVQDVMELLQLFGVPYLVCPMEAEAQCAALEQIGLVDGIITDDSDIFVFGGKKVYKNIFHNQKFVEAFFAKDVERELGFSQDEMIELALLLGSDYTDGIRGIGIVNASEVVSAYPGVEGLKEFKKWVQTFDVAEEAQRRLEKKKSQAELDAMTPRERFEYTHASARRKWELGDEFPNPRVVQAYKNPQVDRSEAQFSWELPDLAGLREYCTRTFGWEQSKTDAVLLPLMEQIASFASNRQRQTRIDQFFTKYDDNVKYASIRSKRLRSAVEGKTGKATPAPPATKSKTKSPTKVASSSPTRTKKARFTKTKKTTSTLGM